MALKPPEEKTVVQRYLPTGDRLPKHNWTGWVRSDLLTALTVWALTPWISGGFTPGLRRPRR